MLDEGVVAEAQDIDLCLITGAGWPFHLGGITPYLDREGVSERVNGKPFLAAGRGERPGVASDPRASSSRRHRRSDAAGRCRVPAACPRSCLDYGELW